LFRGPINDGDALAVDVARFRQIYKHHPAPPSGRRPHPTQGLPQRHLSARIHTRFASPLCRRAHAPPIHRRTPPRCSARIAHRSV
jgi:hypothetical protein